MSYDSGSMIGIEEVNVMETVETIQKARLPKEKIDIWNLPKPKMEEGKFAADWESLSAYQAPDWFRDAKFGFWSHWDPQSVPEEGDWYARWMYDESHKDNAYHKEHYGNPAQFGYKELCGLFTAKAFDPEEMIALAKQCGAGYFLCLANHHDNFDNFDSKYQPWNSTHMGPFRDIVGDWCKAAREAGLRIGVSYHATPGRVWGQFMPVRYGKDCPGDGRLTVEDGKGTWWEGLDPKDLYGPVHDLDDDPLESPFANQFLQRVNDLMKYQPDLICFDESVGNLRDLGAHMGLGVDKLSPWLLAHYYNLCMKWHDGKADGIMTMKDIGGRYNSVADTSLHATLHQAFVNGIEKGTEDEIADYPFQTEDSFAEWHYQKGMEYKSAEYIIGQLADVVSRNGNLAICIPQHGDGSIDKISREICDKLSQWLTVNGEAIFRTRPFEVYGEGEDVRYTRRTGVVYAILTRPQAGELTLTALGSKSVTMGEILKAELLGGRNIGEKSGQVTDEADALAYADSNREAREISFIQRDDALTLRIPQEAAGSMPIVLKLTGSRMWMNDDDSGITYDGWIHRYRKNSGNYNNDLHIAKHLGASAKLTAEGSMLTLYAAKGPEYGALEIRIDGKWTGMASLYDRQESSCVKVYEQKLTQGVHQVEIISAHASPANLDAIVIK